MRCAADYAVSWKDGVNLRVSCRTSPLGAVAILRHVRRWQQHGFMSAFREWLRRKGIVRRMSRYRRSNVVRMFPEWGNDGVLWYAGGVTYEDSGLDTDLIAELRAWERAYFDGLDEDGDEIEWRSPELERAHHAEGVRLARRVSDGLGNAFVIDLDGKKFRSAGPPSSPAAATAFAALADLEEARYNEMARQIADGAEFYWSPYPPDKDDKRAT